MAITELAIFNQALALIAVESIEQADIDASPATEAAAIQYNLFFDDVRDTLLNDYTWKFSEKRKAIGRTRDLVADGTACTEDYWTVSPAQAGEYYLKNTAPGYTDVEPGTVSEDGTAMTAGTVGSLAAGEWDWGDNDSLNYNTIYVRITGDVDPDSKCPDSDYVTRTLATPIDVITSWDYAYQPPSDMLRLVALEYNEPFEYEGGVIKTNTSGDSSSEINIKYIARIENVEHWDMGFQEAFKFKMATTIAAALASKTSISGLIKRFEDAIGQAIIAGAAQKNKKVDEIPTNAWVDRGARFENERNRTSKWGD